MVSETNLKKIISIAIDELGNEATKENVEAVVGQVLEEFEKGSPSLTLDAARSKPFGTNANASATSESTGRIIVTAFGQNHPGIMSGLTDVLARHGCDLQDVSQKIMQDLFTLIMLVDISKAKADFQKLKTELSGVGEKIGVRVSVQHEDIFKAMHRV